MIISLYAVSKEILSILFFLFLHEIIVIIEIICLYGGPVRVLRLLLLLLCDFFEQITKFLIKGCFFIWLLRNWHLKMIIFFSFWWFYDVSVNKISFSFFKLVFEILKLFLIVFNNWSLMTFSLRIRNKFVTVLKLFYNWLSCSLWLPFLWFVKDHFYFLSNIKHFFIEVFIRLLLGCQ